MAHSDESRDGAITYLTYLPFYRAYEARIAQCVELRRHVSRVVLLFDSPRDCLPQPLPEGVVVQCLYPEEDPGSRTALDARKRLLKAILGELPRAAGETLVIDDWLYFASPFFPWLRWRRRRLPGRVLLLYSPVSSHWLWFRRNSLRTLWTCRDFSLWRGRHLPQEWQAHISSDAVSVQSQGLKALYRSLWPTRPVIVTPNAQDPAPAAVSGRSRAECPLLVYAGNFSNNKGLDLLLDLHRAGALDGYRVALAGRGHRAEGRRLEARLRDAGFELPGWLPEPEMKRLFDRGDILILPSRHEGMPRVVTEFLALGKPVVASDLPGLSDIRSPLLLRFPAGDALAFRAAIDNAAGLTDPDAATLAANSAALAEFTPAATARKKAEQLLGLLGGHGERTLAGTGAA